jgi:hypothetical protein
MNKVSMLNKNPFIRFHHSVLGDVACFTNTIIRQFRSYSVLFGFGYEKLF